jgi:hypothetical protein
MISIPAASNSVPTWCQRLHDPNRSQALRQLGAQGGLTRPCEISNGRAPRAESNEAGIDREGGNRFAFTTTGRPPEVANITTIAAARRT